MTEKAFRQLNIDPEFKNLIRPLRREEYRQLELNLVMEGCREDIIAWNDTILDGHNRYEICNKMRIPYGVRELDFPSRDAAIAWICANQLGRRNISEETRKYLIGKQYEAEKKNDREKEQSKTNQRAVGLETGFYGVYTFVYKMFVFYRFIKNNSAFHPLLFFRM